MSSELFNPWEPLTTAASSRPGSAPYEINNVVCTCKVNNYYPLTSKPRTRDQSRFKPDDTRKFSDPQITGTFLIFKSGRVVIVGLKGTEHLPIFLAHLQRYLSQNCGYYVFLSDISIQNIVVDSRILTEDGERVSVDLAKLQELESDKVTFVPEQFPGARVTLMTGESNDIKYSINLFQSGNYVLPGIKDMAGVLVANDLFLDFIMPLRSQILKQS